MSLDKIRGSLAGGFLGDALGAPHEFRYNSHLEYTGELIHPTVFKTRWTEARSMPPGQVTDDSEMTMALIWSILKCKGYNPKEAVNQYIEWANSGTYMLGNNTRYLFKGIKAKKEEQRIKTFSNRYKKKFESEVPWELEDFEEKVPDCQSNGSLMRCSPLALFQEPYEYIDCSLTNPNQINREAISIFIHAIRMCYYEEQVDKKYIFYSSKDRTTLPEVKKVFEQVEKKEERNIKAKGKGWVLHSLYCAFFSFLHFDTFEEAMKWIIEKGGDTDTNAAIAGNLIGAYLGFKKLMENEITKENWEKILSVDTSKGNNPRPAKYHPSNFNDLTKRLSKV